MDLKIKYAPVGTLPEAFIQTVYQQLVKRGPDEAGSVYWVKALASVMERGSLINLLIDSPEFVKVHAAYPDSAGRAIASLLMGHEAGNIFGPLIQYRLDDSETREVTLDAVAQAAVENQEFLSASTVEKLLGQTIGWLDGYSNGCLRGWVIPQSDDEILRLYVGGKFAGESAVDYYRNEFDLLGIRSGVVGFSVEFEPHNLPHSNLNRIEARVGNSVIPPRSRFVSAWVSHTLPALDRLGIRDFKQFQRGAFRR